MWEEATVFRRNSYRHMLNRKTPHRKAPFDMNPGPSCVQATLLTTEPLKDLQHQVGFHTCANQEKPT